MSSRLLIRPREYHDSVRLMQVSERVRRESGAREAILMMATDNNKKILAAAGIQDEALGTARADDLVIAVVADGEEQAGAALALASELLNARSQSAAGSYRPRTLEAALVADRQSNIALISVPGDYAAAEARRALNNGLNVMLFSDNVSIEEELSLKQQAAEQGLLLMGPDCGTAIINGVGLGFANAVARGPVGIVGASGTGVQEISVLLDRMGVGISQAIGTGGRDLKAEIGGLTMLMAMDMLAADPDTRLIVLTSKPPAALVTEKILARAAELDKPVVVNFLGAEAPEDGPVNVQFTASLEDTAIAAARHCASERSLPLLSAENIRAFAKAEAAKLAPGQRYVRGLYAGGTLCYEALLMLSPVLGEVYSNLASDPACQLPELMSSVQHSVVDLGDDAYTQGRAHPMIDPTLRMQRIAREADDPEAAVLLLDLVLGFGAHDNPAAELVEAITVARAKAAEAGRYLPVIVNLCGTDADSQQCSEQLSLLRDAEITVAWSNAEAVRMTLALLGEIHG